MIGIDGHVSFLPPKKKILKKKKKKRNRPLGQPAPFMHCHADDTTIHATSAADAAAMTGGQH